MSLDPSVQTRAHIYVSGIVQGVFYRGHTQQIARSLRLTGWVRNLPDSRVEAVFEGPMDSVQKALSWCRIGSPSSQVDRVDVEFSTPTGEFRDFRTHW